LFVIIHICFLPFQKYGDDVSLFAAGDYRQSAHRPTLRGTTHSPRIAKPKSETTFREGFYHNLPVGLHHLHHHLGHGGVAHPFFSPMAAKVTKRLWDIGDIVGVLEA
jgi:hypothetical protein